MSLGEKVFESRNFRPEDVQKVEDLKAKAAELWVLIHEIPLFPEEEETARLVALAKTDLESSAMWAVKAYSRRPK